VPAGEYKINFEDRVQLRASRYAANHQQEDAAAALVDLLASRANQPTVSNWETGRVKSLDAASWKAVKDYCTLNPASEEQIRRANEELLVIQQRSGRKSTPTDSSDVARPDESLVSATLRRLELGPPLSEADERTITLLVELLGGN